MITCTHGLYFIINFGFFKIQSFIYDETPGNVAKVVIIIGERANLHGVKNIKKQRTCSDKSLHLKYLSKNR
jgi:hypothetical protein